MKYEHLLSVEKTLFQPGGTALRIEVLELVDRCGSPLFGPMSLEHGF